MATAAAESWKPRYTGGGICNREGCGNPVLDTPIVVFKAKGHAETEQSRVPVRLPAIAFCEACKLQAAVDFSGKWAEDFCRERLLPVFRGAGLADPEFLRVEWERVAEAA